MTTALAWLELSPAPGEAQAKPLLEAARTGVTAAQTSQIQEFKGKLVHQ